MASKRGPESDGSDESEKRRRVAFNEVKVFRFRRRQGYVCVPSQVHFTPHIHIVDVKFCIHFVF